MDSMRNLHTSLPSEDSPRRARRSKTTARPSANLIEAFRAAATSVTNLYKTSLADQNAMYESGYQDALSDLLTFLDKQNLGLQDGEGWSVRQWATERYLGSGSDASAVDSEEDEEQRARSSSPVKEEESKEETAAPVPASPLVEVVPEPELPPRRVPISAPSRVDFTFQSSRPWPTASDVDMNSADAMAPNTPSSRRSGHRNSRNSNHRSANRTSQSSGTIGSGAGMKRKNTFPDFFGLQNFPGNDRDGGAGGKRGRFV